MQMERDNPILFELAKSPLLQGHFVDKDDLEDFFDSLDTQELRIIIDSNDPKVLLEFKEKVRSDLDDTAKQLAMDG